DGDPGDRRGRASLPRRAYQPRRAGRRARALAGRDSERHARHLLPVLFRRTRARALHRAGRARRSARRSRPHAGAVGSKFNNHERRSGAMTTRVTALGGALALSFAASAFAQRDVDAAFTATGESCDEVTWSEEALEQYPNIASACREVMERDGEYFVRFEGEVRRVA